MSTLFNRSNRLGSLTVCFFLALICVVVLLRLTGCSDDEPKAPSKNRVPTMQEQLDQAQKAAADAQAAAKAAQDALAAQQNQSSNKTQIEHTAFGRVTDVTEIWEAKDQSTWGDAYITFTFVEEGGFSKKFYPTCANQTIPAGKIVALNYHWGESEHAHGRGCYVLDGFTEKK